MKMYKILILGTTVFLNTQITAKCDVVDHVTTESLPRNHRGVEREGILDPRIARSSGTFDYKITNDFAQSFQNADTGNSLRKVDSVSRVLVSKTESLEDLPKKIQIFIKERNKPNADFILKLPALEKGAKDYLADKSELTFSSASTYTLSDKSKQYEVFVKFHGITDLPLIFDENANLIWVGSFQRLESLVNFDDLSGGPSKIKQEALRICFGNLFCHSIQKNG